MIYFIVAIFEKLLVPFVIFAIVVKFQRCVCGVYMCKKLNVV